MALNIELRDLVSGQPVRPDFQPFIPKNKTENVGKRASVKTFRDLTQVNKETSASSPIEIGFKATRIARQFQSGTIDIFA